MQIIDQISEYFAQYGDVESIDIRTNGNFRYGFVQFKNEANAKTVLLKSRHRIGHCVISVKAANPWNQPEYKSNPLLRPPEQDSALHILAALNDQCFYEIFKCLDLPDLLNVAEVCVRFSAQAKKTFASSKYKRLVFTGTAFSDQPDKMESVLQHFGSHIQSLCIESQRCVDDMLLRAIVQHCQTNLKELRLEFFHIEEDSPDLGPLFSKLEKLELLHCKSHIRLDPSMANCSELKLLRLDYCDLDNDDECIARTFIKLEEAHFSNTILKAETIEHFIVSNPTLIKLSFNQVFDVPHALHLIGENLSNLQHFELMETNYELNFQTDVRSIGQLASLKVLKLNFNWLKAAPLLSALATNSTPIEHLKMERVWIDDVAVDSISKMKKMKILEVDGGRDLTNEHLIEFAKELPDLQELELYSAAELTMLGLKQIIKHGTKINLLKLKSNGDLAINIDDYNEILHIVLNRTGKSNLLVEITTDYNVVTVPEEILNENRKSFFIVEKEEERDHETISNDSNHLNDDDSWFSNEMDDEIDFVDEFFDADMDDDDDEQPAVGYLNGRRIFLG